MGIQPTESFVIIYHEDIGAARRFYEDILTLEIREVTYDWFIGYWISNKHETTLCVSSSPDERARRGASFLMPRFRRERANSAKMTLKNKDSVVA